MATAGSIIIDLLMKTGAFETDSKRAEKRLRQLEKEAKQVGKAIGLFIAAGAGIAVAALKSTINSMDEMSKAAQRVQMPTEDFSRLAFAGSLADVSVQDLTGSLGKLAKAQGDAQRSTSVQGKLFDALGISTKNLDGSLRNTKDVFLDFADVFQQQKGSPEIMAAGMNLFGRSFQNLIPLLKDGSAGLRAAGDEADRLGITLSTKAGQEAEAFNDNLTRLKTAAGGFAQQVASELLPRMVTLTDQFGDLATDGSAAAKVADSLEAGFNIVAGTLGFVAQAAREAGIGFGYLMEAAAAYLNIQKQIVTLGFADGTIKGSVDRFRNAGQVAAEMIAEERAGPTASAPRVLMSGRDAAPESMFRNPAAPGAESDAINRATRKALGDPDKKSGSSRDKAAEEAIKAQQDALRELQEQISKTMDAKAEFGSQLEDLTAQMAGPLAVAELDHKRNLSEIAELAKTGEVSARDLASAQELLAEQYAKVTEQIEAQRTPAQLMLEDMQFELDLLGMTNKERERAIALRYAGVDAMSEEGQAISALSDELGRAREQAALLEDVKLGLADAFVDIASGAKSAKEAFGDFADDLFATALRFVADTAINAFFDAMKSGGAGRTESGGFDWGGAVGSVLSAFGGGRAGGGDVMGSRPYLVGEQGPEMFVPRTAGTILTAAETASRGASGGFTQIIHQNYSAPNDPGTRDQAAAKTAFETRRATARNS